MSDEDLIALGKACREQPEGNYVIGAFAADLVRESYPFSKAMAEIVFKAYSDIELGKKFVEWDSK